MRKTIIGLVIAGLTAMQGAPLLAQEDQPNVQELANRWTAAYNRADVNGVATLYSPSAEVYIHQEGRFVGRDDIRDYWAGDMGRSNPITVLHVTDSTIDTEMMLVHGNYEVIDRLSGVPLGSGRFAHIWVLNDGEWVLDRDIWVDRGH